MAILLLVFLSGLSALVYQVLWLKELGLLFGSTAHAAATALAVFFLGLAAGSELWGRRAPRAPSPLRLYALLEVGIALSALLYFGLFRVYQWLYAPLYSTFEESDIVLVGAKLLLALVVLPPAVVLHGRNASRDRAARRPPPGPAREKGLAPLIPRCRSHRLHSPHGGVISGPTAAVAGRAIRAR